MDYSKEIKELDIAEHYQTEILGLGEIYEIMSVEKLRKEFSKKYFQGKFYLSSNKAHSERGLTLSELCSYLKNQGVTVDHKGYTDSPPWLSKPLTRNEKKSYSPTILFIAKIIFIFILPLEFIWRGSKRSHMIYCFSKKS